MTCRWLLPLFLLILLPSPAPAAVSDIPATLRSLSSLPALGRERIHNSRALVRFYKGRDYRLVWSDGRHFLPVAEELLAAIPAAAGEGLDPRDYHLFALNERVFSFRSAPTPRLAAEVDLLLSDAFLSLSSHYLQGRILPAAGDGKWHIPGEKGEPLRLLDEALASGRVRAYLQALLPSDPAYAALRSAWQDLQFLAAVGGWPQLTLTLPLRPGASGAEVEALRRRLVAGGDLSVEAGRGESFDPELEGAVRRFQTRHGLTIDGIVGRQTFDALNIPAATRARQLRINLERWRWLPRSFGPRHLRVNLPAFDLELIENAASVLKMRVIVGRQVRQTPAFVGKMTYLVLNPYWEVPRNLAVADLLPKIQEDRGYLSEQGIKVFTSPGGSRLDPASIEWSELNAAKFPYHLRQDPGPKNSLGRIKFIFPNRYNIYLHDTPTRKLFARDQRSFSSGCIRIEKPFELAQLLLRGTALADRAALDEEMLDAVNEVVMLPSPLPVYLLYFTAWVEADGTLNFRPDLYQRDSRLAAALRQPEQP